MKSLLAILHHPVLGYHVLRVSIAAMMLLHGIAKLGKGMDGIQGMLTSHGLPAFVAYGVFIGELVAPLLAIANVWVGPAALVMAINMLFAIGLVHMHQIFTLGPAGGWGLETQGLFLSGAVALALLAPARRG
jgi:putative oxidoreductase